MKNFLKLLSTFLLMICVIIGLDGCGNETKKEAGTNGKMTVIYTNADGEAQLAIRAALDENGFRGKYLLQTFGTAELGAKLSAEGRHIEADVVQMTSYYLDSAQKKHRMFIDLPEVGKPLKPHAAFYLPTIANCGALFVNTQELHRLGLPMPKSIKDLSEPQYEGHISVSDIMTSSTAWLMTQAALNQYGEAEGAAIMRKIEHNAAAHLEQAGAGPLKRIRNGEAAAGFGLRHQAVADKSKGLPVDFIDPAEGNFMLTEAVAVVDKGAQENEQAKKIAECIAQNARPELLKIYPVPLYAGEKVRAENQPAALKTFKETLTVDLLQRHQKLIKQ